MEYNKPKNKRPINMKSINRAKLKGKLNNLEQLNTLYCTIDNMYYYLTKDRFLIAPVSRCVIGKWILFDRIIQNFENDK